MVDAIIQILLAAWLILCTSAPYVLFGLLMAGLLKGLIPDSFVTRHLGGNSARAVIKASLLGMPLPLCSCGVLPVAASLKKQGAGPGPTTAFLISTPETGVDSIAITYALLDPVMTVIRPLAALITATSAGLLVNLLPARAPAPACSLGSSCCEHGLHISAVPPSCPFGVRYRMVSAMHSLSFWVISARTCSLESQSPA